MSPENCDYCGRFMKFIRPKPAGPLDFGLDDHGYWRCSQDSEHMRDNPYDFGRAEER